jgi:LysM repeat protein
MAKGFDCATKLTKTTATALKKLGYEYVFRYLGPDSSWKSFSVAEAKIIKDAGLKLVSICQLVNNGPSYFSYNDGAAIAKYAMEHAKRVGQPQGTAIYFAVDFDAQSKHMDKIKDHFKGIKDNLKGYKVGIYGSYDVMVAMKGKVDYYWQTYAWSNKKVADFIHAHQYQNNVKEGGITIDRNDVKKTPGDWTSGSGVIDAPKQQVGAEIVTKPNKPTTKRKKNSDGTYTVVSGDTLSEIAADFNVSVNDLASWNKIANKNQINAGQKLKFSADKKATAVKPATSSTKKITIKKGDTLSRLAVKYKTTVSNLKALNGYKSDTIYAGKTMKVPSSASSNTTTKKNYIVKSGDNATKIAKNNGITLDKLKELNPSKKNWDLVYPGDKLRIK